jgi:AraC-like DNA-binding protein
MLYLAGTSISFFLALILFGKKNKNLADKILAAWLSIIGIHLFFFYCGITDIIFLYPWLLGIHLPIPLLHGPCLYLYVLAQTGHLQKWTFKSLVHFIPALLNYVYLIHFFLLPASDKISVYKNSGQGYETYLAINSIAIALSGIGYVISTAILLRQHRKAILNEFSSTIKIDLAWIQKLIYGIAAIWLLVIFGNDVLIFTAAVLFVLFIGYFGIKQEGIFSATVYEEDANKTQANQAPVQKKDKHLDNISVEPIAKPDEIFVTDTQNDVTGGAKKKYSKSGLTDGEAKEIHETLILFMRTEKCYKQSDLTLNQLAKKLATHPNHLSQVINQFEQTNFYDYINTLRVEDLKERMVLPENQKYTLLSLALDSGFNSKSTFNKYFRKVTGLSPSEYMDSVQIQKKPSPDI